MNLDRLYYIVAAEVADLSGYPLGGGTPHIRPQTGTEITAGSNPVTSACSLLKRCEFAGIQVC